MKKLIGAVLLVAVAGACHSSSSKTVTTNASPVMSGNQTGASDATSAVRAFMAAAKAQDLQAISGLWGDQEGSARGRYAKADEERREILMVSCLQHDRYDVVSEAPAQAGGREILINMSKPGKTATATFTVLQAKDRRWYVKQFDLDKLLANYCRR